MFENSRERKCVWEACEFCTNDQCPMVADYCPVMGVEGVCKYEELEVTDEH